MLFGQPIPHRARETGVPERTLRRRVARFAARGMRSLFAALTAPPPDRRRLPAEIRQAIVALKAEYPPPRVARDRQRIERNDPCGAPPAVRWHASSEDGVHIPVTFLTNRRGAVGLRANDGRDRSSVEGVAAVHAVRARWVGHRVPADLHITVDPRLSVAEAHEIAHRVERSLVEHLPTLSDATVHVCPGEADRVGDSSQGASPAAARV